MSPLSEAESFLLDQVRAGEPEGWSTLVERFQGRLLAFARQQVSNGADAEDLVQDTFISFLKGLERFRGDAGLETYLFTILRRRIIDQLRGRKKNICQLRDGAGDEEDGNELRASHLASDEPTASWYARQDEEEDAHRRALAATMTALIADLKDKKNLEALQVMEGVYYAQLRNKDVADLVGVSEQRVGQIKHRTLARAKELAQEHLSKDSPLAGQGGEMIWQSPQVVHLLSEIWEEARLTCPKRTTLGRFVLGTLEPDWQKYVSYHAEDLGCGFCAASVADLKEESKSEPVRKFEDRLMQSTIGFFKGHS